MVPDLSLTNLRHVGYSEPRGVLSLSLEGEYSEPDGIQALFLPYIFNVLT